MPGLLAMAAMQLPALQIALRRWVPIMFRAPAHSLTDVHGMQVKQTETGWDIDARLLLYADAIKRTELLAGLKPSMPPAKATVASEGPVTSSPCVADDLNCQDGLPKGLHVKTRY